MNLPDDNWTALPVPEMDHLPRQVFLRAKTLAAGHGYIPHRHHWHQFVCATSGALLATIDGARHVITTDQAIWIPRDTEHTIAALHGTSFSDMYIADLPGLDMPRCCTVVSLSPLLRSLVAELNRILQQGEDESSPYHDRIDALILDQLCRQEVRDYPLPWPVSASLRQMCEHLYDHPDDSRDMTRWGKELGASPRTLARHFERETGMTLRDWRLRLRLFRAVEWLGAGRNITEIALDLGYASPSAFSFMFRKETGYSPGAWRLPDKKDSGFRSEPA